ncbi:hypothetical protein DXG03_007619 [Asterophora parasitica]|uniref:Uncharacterized protein n=1 Tax=Asterophora parasitica TaxID=117018 RepID=A0A9P7GCQ3_9AGAR|nr:hypothetical protein DXG03_007619 [Asterophora parasitica]
MVYPGSRGPEAQVRRHSGLGLNVAPSMTKESPSPDAVFFPKVALDDPAISQRPQRLNSNLSTLASLSPGEREKEKIEPSDLEDQSHIWAGYEQDVLPDKTRGGVIGNLRYQILQVYRRLFGMVFLINVGLFISVAVKGAVAPQIGLIALSNLFVAVALREDYLTAGHYQYGAFSPMYTDLGGFTRGVGFLA